jgi:hypothetical protein
MSRNQPSMESSGLMSWRGTLPWFAPMAEGGPGQPLTLGIQAVLALALGGFGVHLIETRGIDSGGPPLVLLAIGWGLFLVVWLLIKGVLRGRDVEFILSDKGVEICPPRRQQNLDRGMKVVSRLVFLLTYKGGQWSDWHPATRWKDVRTAEYDEVRRHIVLRGGAWTIRLVCGSDEYGRAAEIIREQLAARPVRKPKAEPKRAVRAVPDAAAVAAGPGGWAWLFRIGLPLVLLAAAVGAAAGAARWAVGFIPGMQGMLTGGVLGWLAGRRARREDVRIWGGGQRFWLWLNLTLTCALAGLAVLSVLRTPPLAGPLEWLGDVTGGYAREAFFGARAIDPVHGTLSGGWWIGFNVLDIVLFFFLGILVLGATVQRRLEPGRKTLDDPPRVGEDAAGIWAEDNDEEEPEEEVAPGGPFPLPHARRLFWIQWVVAAAVLTGVHLGAGRSPAMRYDPSALARLQELTGRFAFDDGQGLLAPSGRGGAFTVQVWGGNGLFFRSEPDGEYGISLDGEGRDFRGRLYQGSRLIPVRARFAGDGQTLTLAGPVYVPGGSRVDGVVQARRTSP